MSISGISKRGKGRPKGSKNKSKEFLQPVKIESGYSEPLPFGKRGKGRPKGSKNKIKLASQMIMGSEFESQFARKKGRPLGAKNRANSVESLPDEN